MPEPKKQLRDAREKRGWSQVYVARQIETDAYTVGRWERGVQEVSSFFRQKLCELFEMDAIALGLIKEEVRDEMPKYPLSNMPFFRNPYYVEGGDTLTMLHSRLVEGQSGVSLVTLHGLGGIGKTQLALEYAYSYLEQYTAVLWLHADTQEHLAVDLEELAFLSGVPETKKRKPNRAYFANEVKQWLREHNDWLLILDNAEEGVSLDFQLGMAARGHVIVTTRVQKIAERGQHVLLEKMSMEWAALLLLCIIHSTSTSTALEDFPVAEREEALALARVLDGLPLALEQASAYIVETGCGLVHYRRRYDRYRKVFLAWKSTVEKTYSKYEDSVATTWNISFQRVKRQSAAALAILNVFAFLAPDAIPSDIVLNGKHEAGSELHHLAEDLLLFEEACSVLNNYSLVRRNVIDGMLSLHRLVQAVLQDRMNREQQRQWVERTVQAVETAWPMASGQDVEHYLPHAYTCAKFINELEIVNEEAALLLERAANVATEYGWYPRAEKFYLRAVNAFSDLHPDDEVHKVLLFMDVARAQMKQGHYPMATRIYNRFYEDCVRLFGSDHPTTLTCLNELALAHVKQGTFQLAIETAHLALEKVRKEPLVESAESAMTYQVAGEVCQLVNLDNLAESHYYLALIMRRKVFGPKSPEVVPSLLALVVLYTQQEPMQAELLSKAEELLEEAVEICVAALGEDHPKTGDAKLRLSMFLLQQGQLEQAEPLCRQAVTVLRYKLGSAHILTGEGIHGLAVILREQGQYHEAEEHFLEAKDVYMRAGGPESGLYLQLLFDYSEVLHALGRDNEAKEYEKYITTTMQRVSERGPLLSFELPGFEEGDVSGHMFFVPRFREEV